MRVGQMVQIVDYATAKKLCEEHRVSCYQPDSYGRVAKVMEVLPDGSAFLSNVYDEKSSDMYKAFEIKPMVDLGGIYD